MRWTFIIFIFLLMPALLLAEGDPRQAKIDAANTTAVTALLADISRQPITQSLSVREFLTGTKGTEALVATLKQADQIGGPRWIDEQTCQVRLEISGQKVADSLLNISNAAGDKSPLKEKALQAALKEWDRRTFTATGTSPGDVNFLVAPATQPAHIALPKAPPRWVGQFMSANGKNGPDRTKLRAARAAETKALSKLREQIDDLALTDKATVGQAAEADPALSQAIDRAVRHAKLTKLDYQADGGAAVQATLDLADVWREIDVFRPENR